jgi:P27 family predicted phage terminase small subunit
MRGRKPKPAKLKILGGNPGKRAIPTAEVGKAPSCPKHLETEAKAVWRRILKEKVAAGQPVHTLDADLLAAYCNAFVRWLKAKKMVNEFGAVLESDAGGWYQNPWLSVENKAFEQMTKLQAELGLTPAGRARQGTATPKEDAKQDSFAEFLRNAPHALPN